jgi:hypothetical protein
MSTTRNNSAFFDDDENRLDDTDRGKEIRKRPTINTRQRLYALAGNECSFPDCSQVCALEDSLDLLSNICHIEGALPTSPRYNALMTPDERREFDNLIILCAVHHIVTNDEKIYTIASLKQMRRDHHADVARRRSAAGILRQHPSSLVIVINRISSEDFFDVGLEPSETDTFVIDQKITFNQVERFRPIIEEYRVYQGRLTRIYKEIEEQGSYRKELLLQNIRGFYLEAKGKIIGSDNSIENIRRHADNLISSVQEKLLDVVLNKSNNLSDGVSLEAITVAVSVVVVDAFLRCKILEEPVYDSKQGYQS